MNFLVVLTLCLLTQTLASPVINIVVNAGGGGGDDSSEESMESRDSGDGGQGGQGRHGGSSGTGGRDRHGSMSVSARGSREPNSYMIAYGEAYAALEYKNELGQMKGFHLDLVEAVCKFGGLNCTTVLEPYSNCINEDAYGGEGLIGKWYDACIGWDKTQGRTYLFQFADPYLLGIQSYVYTKEGSSYENNDDISQLSSIGFVAGFAYSPECVNREFGILEETQIKYYDGDGDAIQAVLDDEIDAVFMTSAVGDATEGIQRSSSGKYCSLHGGSLMSRKDSSFTAAWNAVFREFKKNGEFAKLCMEAKDKHETEFRTMPECNL